MTAQRTVRVGGPSVSPFPHADPGPPEVAFALPDEIFASESEPWYAHRASVLIWAVYVSLKTVGSTSTSVTLYLNGNAAETFVLPASTTTKTFATNWGLLSLPDDASGYMYVGVTSAGTSAADLTVQVQLRYGAGTGDGDGS